MRVYTKNLFINPRDESVWGESSRSKKLRSVSLNASKTSNRTKLVALLSLAPTLDIVHHFLHRPTVFTLGSGHHIHEYIRLASCVLNPLTVFLVAHPCL